MIPTVTTLGLASVAGLALGSFAVTAGVRLSRGESALRGRSHCDACGRTLSFAQTVPLLSYAGLRGACGGCRARIDPIHTGGEVAGAAVVASSLFADDPLRIVLCAGLGLCLIAAATVDAKARRLPDILTAPIAALGLALAFAQGAPAVLAGLIAAAIAGSVLLGLRELGRRWRDEPGLGLGDVKLVAALALWLGAATPWLIAAASVAGLLMVAATRPADGRLPFGPLLVCAGWIIGIVREAGAWPTTM